MTPEVIHKSSSSGVEFSEIIRQFQAIHEKSSKDFEDMKKSNLLENGCRNLEYVDGGSREKVQDYSNSIYYFTRISLMLEIL